MAARGESRMVPPDRSMVAAMTAENPDVLVDVRLDAQEGRALWHAISTTVSLIDQVSAEPGNEVPANAPLYGQRERLVELARRLDHALNEAQRRAARPPRCSCPCGKGTDPGCQVHP